jgi:hypothetical protein
VCEDKIREDKGREGMTLYIYISSHPCITHIYIEYTVVSEISCAKIR